MTRVKAPEDKKPPGRASDFTGNKLKFVEDLKDGFMEVQDSGPDAVTQFLNKAARNFWLTFGTKLELSDDGPILVAVGTSLGPTAIEFSEKVDKAKHKKLRTKLGQWFRHHTKGIIRAVTSKKDTLTDVLETMHQMVTQRPRKPHVLKAYSKKYYQERLKEGFDATWDKVRDTMEPEARIKMTQVYTRDAWNKESQEFRDELSEEVELQYQQDLEAYRNSDSWQPRTAEEYAQAVADSHLMLLPMADAISQHLGLYVAIMMCGPMDDGKIGLRRALAQTDCDTRKVDPSFKFTNLLKLSEEPEDHIPQKEATTMAKIAAAVADTRDVTMDLSLLGASAVNSAAVTGSGGTTTVGLAQPNAGVIVTAEDSESEGEGQGGGKTPDMVDKGPGREEVRMDTDAPHVPEVSLPSVKPAAPAIQPPSPPMTTQPAVQATSPTAPVVPPTLPSVKPAAPAIQPPRPPIATQPAVQATSPTAPVVPPTGPPIITKPEAQTAAPMAPAVPPPGPRTTVQMEVQPTALTSPSPLTDPVFFFPDPTMELPPPIPTLPVVPVEMIPSQNKALRNEMEYLLGKEWCPSWKQCLVALFEFERSRGFVRDNGRIPNIERPVVIKDWIKEGRPWKYHKIVVEEITMWWRTLKSMTVADDEGEDPDYSVLAKAGKDGLHLMVLCLCWWGEIIEEIGRRYDGREGWLDIVHNVMGMLVFLTANHTVVPNEKPVSKRASNLKRCTNRESSDQGAKKQRK
ncbi:hypothetical protein DXG01_000682 [Tephrocybe rancida]|nr:hypothetical protein DXG01_000682 [Tephrocybe rancida]